MEQLCSFARHTPLDTLSSCWMRMLMASWWLTSFSFMHLQQEGHWEVIGVRSPLKWGCWGPPVCNASR